MNPNSAGNNSTAAYIDIHCHNYSECNHIKIFNLDTLDIQEASKISKPYSLGIHPWSIEQQNLPHALAVLRNRLSDLNLLAIGECGLDKTILTPLELQIHVFKTQIQLASHSKKPLIVHCVRAFNELIQLKKNHNSSTPWIIHGFNRKLTLAQQLIHQGCYLSFGKTLLHENSHARQVLGKIPPDRWFLETDAADEITISLIYETAADIIGTNTTCLQQQLFSNFKRVFPG